MGEYFTSGLFCPQRKHLAHEYFLIVFFFYGEELLAPHQTKLEDHLLSVVRDCLFNLFASTLHILGHSSIRNLRTCHDIVTGTHKHSCLSLGVSKTGVRKMLIEPHNLQDLIHVFKLLFIVHGKSSNILAVVCNFICPRKGKQK